MLAGQAGGLGAGLVCALALVSYLPLLGLRPEGDPSFSDPFILGIKRSPRARPLGPRQEGAERMEGTEREGGDKGRQDRRGGQQRASKSLMAGGKGQGKEKSPRTRVIRSKGKDWTHLRKAEERQATGLGRTGEDENLVKAGQGRKQRVVAKLQGAAGWSRGPGR